MAQNTHKTIKQPGYSGLWSAIEGHSFSANIPDCKTLRGWQERCADELMASDKVNRLIVAPTGSGKSIAINYLISHILNDSPKKIIISVPQRAIGGGFAEPVTFALNPEGDKFDFYIKNNYCSDEYSSDSKAEGVISFLEDDYFITPSDRVLLCVNNTLVNVYNRLVKEDKLSLLDGVEFWFDEAHHIQTENEDVANGLGRLFNYCLSEDISVNAVTATNFRGDRLSIVPRDYHDSFARFTLPYDEHFEKNCAGLGFKYDFVLHEDNWYDAFERVLNECEYSNRKTIVFIPHPNTNAFKSADTCKIESVKKTLSIIKGKKVTNKELIPDDNGVLTLKNNGKNIRVIDLVDEDNRSIKVEHLRSDAGEEVDYVIGINVPKEGFDWPCANREFIIGSKSSLNELMQMMGRTFRGHPKYKGEDKDPVEIFHVLPWVDSEKVDSDELKIALNDYLKAVYLSMIGESIMNPPSDIKIPTRKNESTESDSTEKNEVMEYVIGVLGETGWETFLMGCVDECRKVRTDNEDMPVKERNELIRSTIFDMVFENEKIDAYEEELCDIIFKSFVARSFNLKKQIDGVLEGIDVSGVDFDILSEMDSMYFMLAYSNTFCNADTFKGLREAIGERFFASAEQHREWIMEGGYTRPEWESIGYAKYIKHGSVSRPERTFNISWYWFRGGNAPDASAEQHREWITEGGYSIREWFKIYDRYKKWGAVRKPNEKFKVSWKWLQSKKHIKQASVEQHREWIIENDYTETEWNNTGHKKYKKWGARRDPRRVFGVTWYWLRGNNKPKYAGVGQHREWITEGGYTTNTWSTIGYEKHKNAGALLEPSRKFNVSWYWLRGNNKSKPNASVEEHREWITEGEYSIREWFKVYKKYKKFGAVRKPNEKFKVSWKWLRGLE